MGNQERKEENREEFRERIPQIDPSTIVYVDQSGLDSKPYRTYGRAIRGEKMYAKIRGKRTQRVSIIGGWIKKNFIDSLTFTGSCNNEDYSTWLEQILLPSLSQGSREVMDNAAFYKSAQTKRLIQRANCHWIDLPSYSPDFINPIEHCWNTIKSKIRSGLRKSIDELKVFVRNTIIQLYQLS